LFEVLNAQLVFREGLLVEGTLRDNLLGGLVVLNRRFRAETVLELLEVERRDGILHCKGLDFLLRQTQRKLLLNGRLALAL
jgi:hypothetical protein